MRYRLAPALICFSLALAQTPQKPPASTPPSPDAWKTATSLPNVDLSSLTPAQKKTALASLRNLPCLCGCNYMIAECRVKDTACANSRTMAEIIVKAVKEGKNPQLALSESDFVKRKTGETRILESPIPISVTGAPIRGPADARITLVEFSDFECPFCSKAAAKIETVRQAYPKDLRLIYKQYPLDSHTHAKMAARAALAAQAQDKFWPMHDKLFANSTRLSEETVTQIAKELGLDMDKFQADFHSPKIEKILLKDMADGDKAAVDATPTVFINGKRYNGPLEMVVLKPLLDGELKAKN